MTRNCINLVVIVCAIGSLACAQEVSSTRVCTDLSGKVRLPCPHESPAGQAGRATEPLPADSGSDASPARINVPSSTATPPLSSVSLTATDADSASPAAARIAHDNARYPSLERSLFRNVIYDQKAIVTSPLRLRLDDARWIAPLVGAMTVVTLSDGSIERELPTSPSLIKRSKSFSDYGAAAYAGAVGGAYLFSLASHNDHLRETALLSGEAALNTLLVTEGIKYIAGRDRPLEGDGTGSFRHGGASFPSMHSAGAWSIASVIAREYPGPLTKLLAYGGAAAISAARVSGRQHFASDALVGGTIGWFIGRQVYNSHHDRLSDSAYGTFERRPSSEGPRDPSTMGSPYIPLDSWIYPTIDRLVALGYIDAAFQGMRPWTRMQCAELVDQAYQKAMADSNESDSFPMQLISALRADLAFETARVGGSANLQAKIESVYARFTNLSGSPLTDGYHFGQTITNDFGRPYQEGLNGIAGMSAYAVAGPLVFYVRGEYQHSPFAPALSPGTRNTIASLDGLPAPPAMPFAELNRARLLDAYAGVNISGWQLTVGKQSLWWGPGRRSSLMFTDNAEPINMIRLSRVAPYTLPGFLARILGPIRTESFFGQLGGHQFVFQGPDYQTMTGSYGHFLDPQPFVHGSKISLNPTPNLEIGVSLTAVMAGPGVPLTFSNFFHTFSSHGNAQLRDPGDRRTGFEFAYKVPGLRNWLTIYGDSLAEDEPNPIAYPRRSAMNPGVYLSHFPGIQRLDLRVEGGYTDLPGLRTSGTYYTNTRFRNGYTNFGNIIGSWLGRQGRGVQAWSTYSLAPQKVVEVGYRYANVSDGFVPNGGTINDFHVSASWLLRQNLSVDSTVQYERWKFPVLAPVMQSNVTGSLQLTYRPNWGLGK